MTTTCPDSSLASRSFGLTDLKALLLEPFLILGVSAFWLVTLPFAAVTMLALKTWDRFAAWFGRANSAHPLILQRSGRNANTARASRIAARKIEG